MRVNTSHSIVMLVRAMSGGGAQRDAIELANGLAQQGWPMVIATLDGNGPLRQRIAPAIPLLDLGGGRPLRMAHATPAIRQMIHAICPGAIIASEAAANCLLVHAASNLPRAARPRLLLREVAVPSVARHADPHWQNRLGYRLAPRYYAEADRVLCFTQGVRRELISLYDLSPDTVINLGTNAVLSVEKLAELAQPQPREWGHIVAVGRLSPEKDFRSLILAFAQLRADLSIRLTILGEGPQRPALETLIAQLGLQQAVSLPGYVAEPIEWLARAHVLVSTSRHEGFGNALVEALACGTPVVATDAPHGPREILAEGRFGALVPLGNLCALGNAIEHALVAPADRAALRRRAADFTTDKAAARLGAVLRDLGLAPNQPVLSREAS